MSSRVSIVALLALVACGPKAEEVDSGRALFTDRAADLGIDFQHETGAAGQLYMPETTGAGVALFDYDGDGDLDLYLVQSGMLEGSSDLQDRLYRNDLSAGEEWRFVDVTRGAAIQAVGYGQGVAIGDVDNDGLPDLFLANLGADQLWVNQGDGTFRDATGTSGLGDEGWGTSAVFFDFDRDGWQDLFVTRYLVWTVASHKDCRFQTGLLDYCKPASYAPTIDLLYRNLGDGKFALFGRRELGSLRTNGLGVVVADLNADRWLDIYVANDQLPNALWLNEEGLGFREEALLSGVAVNREGMAEASMGLVAEDLDNDGRIDLFMTHLDGETNTFFRNRGDGIFDDDSQTVGLAAPSLARTAFGVGAIDFDNDSWLDLVMTTGAVHVDLDQQSRGEALPLQQTDQMFRNVRGGFSEMSSSAGTDFVIPAVGRGLAVGDLDNDGDADVVINNAQGRPRVLINSTGQDGRWIGVQLQPAVLRLAEEGTPVSRGLDNDRRQVRWTRRGGSFLSSHDDRILFGLGKSSGQDEVRVDWPHRGSQAWRGLRAGLYYTLSAGAGDRP